MRSEHAAIVAVITAFTLFAMLYNGFLPLFLDEAYYWVWSRNLQAGYFDHPPMVALFLRAASFVGESEAALRLAAALPMGAASYLVWRAAFDAFGLYAARWTLAVLLLSPAAAMGFTIVSPDAPLIFFWATGLYFSYRAVFGGSWRDFLIAGASIGAMLASKYTAVLFLLFLGVFLLWRRPKLLLSAKPYAALALAALIFSPVVWWNYHHDWVSFAFQYKHGTAEALTLRLDKFVEFVGGLFALFSPLVFALVIWGAAKMRRWPGDDRVLFFALACFVPILFFCYKALFKKMELNWVAPALLGAAVFAGFLIDRYGLRRFGIAALLLSAAISLAVKFPLLFGLSDGLNPHNRLFGYKEAAQAAVPLIRPNDTVFADHLTTASIFSYYLPSHPEVLIPVFTRPSQFTLSREGKEMRGKSGVAICTTDRGAELAMHFKKVSSAQPFTAHRKGFRDRIFYFYRVEEFVE